MVGKLRQGKKCDDIDYGPSLLSAFSQHLAKMTVDESRTVDFLGKLAPPVLERHGGLEQRPERFTVYLAKRMPQAHKTTASRRRRGLRTAPNIAVGKGGTGFRPGDRAVIHRR